MILVYLFTALLLLSWGGKSGILADMLLAIMGLGFMFLINKIGTIIFIVIIGFIIWLSYYSNSDKSKQRDEFKFSHDSIKFKEDLY